MTTKQELEQLDDEGMAAWNDHNVKAWVDLFADDFVWTDWSMPEPIRDKAAAAEYFDGWITALPDMTVTTVARVVGDDSVAAELEFSGRHTGPFVMGGQELPPTNRQLTGRGTYIVRVQDGKIVEFRSHPDIAGMMGQLGLLPG